MYSYTTLSFISMYILNRPNDRHRENNSSTEEESAPEGEGMGDGHA